MARASEGGAMARVGTITEHGVVFIKTRKCSGFRDTLSLLLPGTLFSALRASTTVLPKIVFLELRICPLEDF